MATQGYPTWLSPWYRLGPILLPAHRILSRLRSSRPSPGFRVLLFHDIPADRLTRFKRLVRYLQDNHGLLTPDECRQWLLGEGKKPDRGREPCLLTFDDGFGSQARAARKVLDPLGIRAVFFVCPGLMATAPDGQRAAIAEHVFAGAIPAAQLPADMALMSWDDVKGLAEAGHAVGSHTGSHGRLTALGETERKREIVDSGDLLASRLGMPVEWFAYPFGNIASIDAQALAIIRRRYDMCCSGVAGLNTAATGPLAVLRQKVDLDLSFAYQRFVIEGGMDFVYKGAARQYRSMVS